MYYMVLLILNNIEQSPDVLDAWEEAEVPGITILESTGLGTVRSKALRDDIPLMPSLHDLFRSQEHHHRTLFTVVEGEAMVDHLIEVTQRTVGDLEQPHNGVLFVLPVSRVVGLKGAQARARGD
ncbi:MAG: P-II family nitrogen regulator [Chloroflexota bacterium]